MNNKGWECPKCGYIWAPNHPGCNNCNQPIKINILPGGPGGGSGGLYSPGSLPGGTPYDPSRTFSPPNTGGLSAGGAPAYGFPCKCTSPNIGLSNRICCNCGGDTLIR